VTHNEKYTIKLFITNKNGHQMLHQKVKNKCLPLLLQMANETAAKSGVCEDFVVQI
jgi:hypothetical protein